jgi:hypothetical protein
MEVNPCSTAARAETNKERAAAKDKNKRDFMNLVVRFSSLLVNVAFELSGKTRPGLGPAGPAWDRIKPGWDRPEPGRTGLDPVGNFAEVVGIAGRTRLRDRLDGKIASFEIFGIANGDLVRCGDGLVTGRFGKDWKGLERFWKGSGKALGRDGCGWECVGCVGWELISMHFGKGSRSWCGRSPADWKSAIQQTSSLRYKGGWRLGLVVRSYAWLFRIFLQSALESLRIALVPFRDGGAVVALRLFEVFEEIRDLVKNFAQADFASVLTGRSSMAFGRCGVKMERLLRIVNSFLTQRRKDAETRRGKN